jgi:hypothetical protein
MKRHLHMVVGDFVIPQHVVGAIESATQMKR